MRDFSRLGMQFGEHVQKVTAELLSGETPRSASEIERRTRQAVLDMGRFLTGAWLGACRREHSDGVFTDKAEPILVKAQQGTR